jgi:hypothetical protein
MRGRVCRSLASVSADPPPREIGSAAIQPISTDALPAKHSLRPHISKIAIAPKVKRASTVNSSNASRPNISRRISIVGRSTDQTLRPHVSQSPAEKGSAAKRVSDLSSPTTNGSRPGDSNRPRPQPRIALNDPDLLKRQTAPDCEFKSTVPADSELALRALKLDYQQCYRQSESILRARMERLQDAVNKIIESLSSRDSTSAR